MSQDVINRVLKLVQSKRPEAATHWSTREIAKQIGISHTKVHQILRAHDLKPHLVEHFRTSDDPDFEQKLEDVVGLYLNPPENAIVLSIDEKSQVQALERAQPILPLRPGIPERQTHDYERHGVTNLYAALNVASGQVIGTCADRHRAEEYIEFLKLVDQNTPRGKVLHLIVDNASSHDTKAVRDYLGETPEALRCALHPDAFLMAEPGGTVVLGDHHEAYPSGELRQREGTRACDHGLHPSLERVRASLRMDEELEADPSQRTKGGSELSIESFPDVLFVWTKNSKQILRNVRKAAQN